MRLRDGHACLSFWIQREESEVFDTDMANGMNLKTVLLIMNVVSWETNRNNAL